MIGVVTGLRAEAACLPRGGLAVVCSGADAGRAHAQAAALVAQGVRGLVSFGFAAGLGPGLGAGSIVLGNAVVLPSGERIAADAAWIEALRAGVPSLVGPVAGSDHVLATQAAKVELFAGTGALIADMESHGVALAAHAAVLPFAIVRVVLDAADRALPTAALVAVDEEGEVRIVRLLRALLARPGEIAALARLARDHRIARRALLRAGARVARLQAL